MKAVGLAALLAAVAIAVMLAPAAGAAPAGSWIPGSPYMVEETDASDLLEKGFDHAYCEGIPRFGHAGEFPYERFTTFDCSWSLNGKYCSDGRYRSVKDSQRGYFRLRIVRYADCF